MRTEAAILKNLIQNEEYTRKVLPFLKEDYFTENADKTLYGTVNEFVNKYNSLPSEEALQIELSEVKMNEEEYKDSLQLLKDIGNDGEDYTDLTKQQFLDWGVKYHELHVGDGCKPHFDMYICDKSYNAASFFHRTERNLP